MIPVLDIPSAVQKLKQGAVIAYPTETFYGLGVNALDAQAAQKLYQIKGRSFNSAIPVLIPSVKELSQFVQEISQVAEDLIHKFWPGPLTLVFKARECFPSILLGGTQKVAIRVSSHPLASALCQSLGLPLTTTSANPSGAEAARSVDQIEKYFLNQIDGVIAGDDVGADLKPAPTIKPSTLIDVTVNPPKILREGFISKQELMQFIPNLQ